MRVNHKRADTPVCFIKKQNRAFHKIAATPVQFLKNIRSARKTHANSSSWCKTNENLTVHGVRLMKIADKPVKLIKMSDPLAKLMKKTVNFSFIDIKSLILELPK